MPATREQEALARQAGYPSYDAMQLFLQQRSRRRTSQTVTGNGVAPVPTATPTPIPAARNREQVNEIRGWSPSAVFNRIREALAGAN